MIVSHTSKLRLGDIASIQMGYPFRERLDTLEPGQVGIIQMRDLTDQATVETNGIARVQLEPKAGHLVQPGDIFFRSRGQNLSAAMLSRPIVPSAVLAAPLIRIRPNNDRVLPAYLLWALNHCPSVQAAILAEARGTAQPMISTDALRDLQIPVPALHIQQRIAELAQLGQIEQTLYDQIKSKRQQILSAQLIQLAQGE